MALASDSRKSYARSPADQGGVLDQQKSPAYRLRRRARRSLREVRVALGCLLAIWAIGISFFVLLGMPESSTGDQIVVWLVLAFVVPLTVVAVVVAIGYLVLLLMRAIERTATSERDTGPKNSE